MEAAKYTTDLVAKRYAWLVIYDMCSEIISPYLTTQCPCDKVSYWTQELRRDLTTFVEQNSLTQTSTRAENVADDTAHRSKDRNRRSSRRRRTSRYVDDNAHTSTTPRADDTRAKVEDAFNDANNLETFVVKMACKYREA